MLAKQIRNGYPIDYEGMDTLIIVRPEDRECSFSTKSGSEYTFIDVETYDLVYVKESLIPNNFKYVQEGTDCTLRFYKNEAFEVVVPVFVLAENISIQKTGNRIMACLENGTQIEIDAYKMVGDTIRINTALNAYDPYY